MKTMEQKFPHLVKVSAVSQQCIKLNSIFLKYFISNYLK